MLAAFDYVAFPNFSLLLKKIFLPRKQILLRATPYWRKTEHGRVAFPESVSLHPEFSSLINLQSVVVNGSPPMLLPFLQMCMCLGGRQSGGDAFMLAFPDYQTLPKRVCRKYLLLGFIEIENAAKIEQDLSPDSIACLNRCLLITNTKL